MMNDQTTNGAPITYEQQRVTVATWTNREGEWRSITLNHKTVDGIDELNRRLRDDDQSRDDPISAGEWAAQSIAGNPDSLREWRESSTWDAWSDVVAVHLMNTVYRDTIPVMDLKQVTNEMNFVLADELERERLCGHE